MRRATPPWRLQVFVVGIPAEELPDPAPMKYADTDPKRMLVDGSERRLFHVSAIRAAHELQVSWVGDPTGYLERCAEVADCRSGFNVAQFLGCELDTAMPGEDPGCLRIAGQDCVAGGRQIALVLSYHVEGHEEEWTD